MKTKKLTVAQALIKFLTCQYVERDGAENKFFAGCFGIFGHGNLAGIGEALQENPNFPYYQTRNEQAMVHTAHAYAKMKNRLSTFACTSSIGPGATNMITAAAAATINRIPVLLLPGDIFATRAVAPVLQQLEIAGMQDISVNDCFKPVSKYWDRINRPEQLISSLMRAMEVLTSPSETGTVTLALPQDVQPEACDYPESLFEKRIWTIPRQRGDLAILSRAADMIRKSKRPMIISGGGVIYSGAENVLQEFVRKTGIPVGETFAGKGSLKYDSPELLGAVGVTGTPGANLVASEADLIIGIGTRYSDFTTSSKTLFQNSEVKFININVAEFDAYKNSSLPLVADAKSVLSELMEMLKDFNVDNEYRHKVFEFNKAWDKEVDRICKAESSCPISQAEVIGVLDDHIEENDVILNAAGSLPGDLHKLWRTRNSKGFHLEYGNSTMGYEIAGGLGVKMADPSREVYVMVGDGSYLMMSNEIITSIQEDYKLIILLLNNNGFGSIGALSESVGSQRFGTRYRFRDISTGQLDGDCLPVNFAMNAKSLGAEVIEAKDVPSLKAALKEAKTLRNTVVITIETDLYKKVPGYSWWDVPISQVSELESVKEAFKSYIEKKEKQCHYL